MTDRFTVRLVIGSLAALAFAVVIGGIYLTAIDRGLPGELIAIGSAAAGAIGGILSKTGSTEPQEVVGPQGGPLPVVDENGHVNTALITCVACVTVAVIMVIWAFTGHAPFAGSG